MTSRLGALDAYVARGWRPIPLHYIVGGRCSCPDGADCGSAGKHPVFANWTAEVIYNDRWRTWWERRGERVNIGLVAGYDWWVLDVDPRSGGADALAALVAEHGQLPATYTVTTPQGGQHYYWLIPAGVQITNSSGNLPKGLDVRGRGGQVAAPPSVALADYTTRALGTYQVELDVEPVEAPLWLLDLVLRRGGQPSVPAVETAPTPAAGAAAVTVAERRSSPLDTYLAAVLERECANFADAIADGKGRNNALNAAVFACATMFDLDGVPRGWVQAVHDTFEAMALDAGLPRLEVTKTLNSAARGGRSKPRTDWPPAEVHAAPALTELANDAPGEGPGQNLEISKIDRRARIESQDDVGNGRRLKNWFGSHLRWVPERGKWSVYRAGRWEVSNEAARYMAQQMLELTRRHEALLYADTLPTAPEGEGEEGEEDKPRRRKQQASDRERFHAWLAKQRMSTRIDCTLKECAAIPGMSARITDFDAAPYLLNLPNGTLELDHEQGPTLREHRPGDLLTQMTTVDYEPGADRTSWDLFLKRVVPDEAERRALQAAAGYSITGSTGAQVMFVHQGTGANGKSVFADTISRVLGDMAQATPRDTFAGHAGDRHPTDVARMQGKRFLTTIEPRTGSGLDEDLIKQLTGGDMMTARYMRGDYFEFRPTGKIHYFTNHLPRISADNAMWRRIRLFTWSVTIPPEERVEDLAGILASEAGAGILAWLVEGFALWRLGGLPTTDLQRATVQEWSDEEDVVEQWLEERCVRAEGVFTPTHELFASWREYATESGMLPGTKNAFSRRMTEKGLVRHKAGGGIRGFMGLRRKVFGEEPTRTAMSPDEVFD